MALIKGTPLYEPILELEKMFTGFATTPALDIYEKDDNVVVEVAVAGINPRDIAITIENNILSIEGYSDKRSEVDETNYYRREVRSGSFHRVVNLPTSVAGQNAKAEYDKGILTITLPKKEEAKMQKIAIDVIGTQ